MCGSHATKKPANRKTLLTQNVWNFKFNNLLTHGNNHLYGIWQFKYKITAFKNILNKMSEGLSVVSVQKEFRFVPFLHGREDSCVEPASVHWTIGSDGELNAYRGNITKIFSIFLSIS